MAAARMALNINKGKDCARNASQSHSVTKGEREPGWRVQISSGTKIKMSSVSERSEEGAGRDGGGTENKEVGAGPPFSSAPFSENEEVKFAKQVLSSLTCVILTGQLSSERSQLLFLSPSRAKLSPCFLS